MREYLIKIDNVTIATHIKATNEKQALNIMNELLNTELIRFDLAQWDKLGLEIMSEEEYD